MVCNITKTICKKGLKLLDLTAALDSYNQSHCDKIVSAFQERGAAEYVALQDHFKKSWHTIQKKTWNELLESGAEMGALMLLDTIMMNGAGYAASAAGRKFVSEVTTIFKQGSTAREAYCAEVATLGKLVIEDESAVFAAFKELEKHPELVIKNNVSVGEVLAEEIETAKLRILVRNESECLDSIIKSRKLALGEERFTEEVSAQLKMANDIWARGIGDSLIRQRSGSYKDALADFYNLKPLNIKPIPGKEGMIGFLYDGKTVIARLKSTLDTRQTLEFQRKISGKKTQRKKMRYGEEPCRKNG